MVILELENRDRWRNWLQTNHRVSTGVWLVFFKNHPGRASVEYEDAVCEALCFGWIDSLIKRLDDHRYARKFTPRKPASKWSDSNRKRWIELKRDGLLDVAGLAVAPTEANYGPAPEIPDLPEDIADALKADAKAWLNFQKLAPSYRRQFVAWIHMARRADTRHRRIRESLDLLRAGKKLGLK